MSRLAKEVYYDTKGDMVKDIYGKSPKTLIKSQVDGKTITKPFVLVDITRNSQNGCTLWFQDQIGRRYPMGDALFAKYLQRHPVKFGEQTIEFYKQGHTYSIGFKGD